MDDKLQSRLDMALEYGRMIREDTPVYICNKPATIGEVVCAQIRDEGQYCYMADFITDEEDRLLGLNFDKIPLN